MAAPLPPILNKNNEFPIPTGVWDRMWTRAQTLYPEREQLEEEIRGKPLAVPPIPKLACVPSASVEQQLTAIQRFVEAFQYNHTGTQFFEVKKDKPLSRLLETAKDILREALPIKCLEAVIVFIHLTMELESVDRFPISFKSAFHGQQHRHIVLGVRHGGRYGALGLSRRDTLMFKPLTFTSLAALMADYTAAYAAVGHTLVRVRVGRAVPHDPHSSAPIDWRALVLHPTHFSMSELSRVFDRFARGIRAGTLPSEALVLRHPERERSLLAPRPILAPSSPSSSSSHARLGAAATSAASSDAPSSPGVTVMTATTASFSLSGTLVGPASSSRGSSARSHDHESDNNMDEEAPVGECLSSSHPSSRSGGRRRGSVSGAPSLSATLGSATVTLEAEDKQKTSEQKSHHHAPHPPVHPRPNTQGATRSAVPSVEESDGGKSEEGARALPAVPAFFGHV
eukprot:m.10040 g.10040  ORF g.10040 m.10040 type:complete len:455 (+) comp5525_c0_seq1:27-1391(+)